MHTGEKIRQFRKKKGLNLKEFGRAIDYSYVHVSNIERGVLQPSREFLKKLNEIFGISSDYILYDTSPDQVTPDLLKHPGEYIKSKKEIIIINGPESKYQILPMATKKLINNAVKILESNNDTAIDILKSGVKGALEIVHISKKNNENKSKGGD